jgi:hypothetical protein
VRHTVIFVVLCLSSVAAFAGMPSVTLSDLATAHLSAISFFLLLILMVAVGVKVLWNTMQRDFPRLPRIDYKRALVLVVLLGLLFDVILLMIAATREIMTPEAWEKSGTTYQLREQNASTQATLPSDAPTSWAE